MKKSYYAAFFYLIIGMLSGVFYREYTKHSDFDGQSVLGVAHTHLLVLGFLFFLVVLILCKLFEIHKHKQFNLWFIVYNVAFIIMIGALIARGMMQIEGADFAGLPHIAGLSHTLMFAALVWFLLLFRKQMKE